MRKKSDRAAINLQITICIRASWLMVRKQVLMHMLEYDRNLFPRIVWFCRKTPHSSQSSYTEYMCYVKTSNLLLPTSIPLAQKMHFGFWSVFLHLCWLMCEDFIGHNPLFTTSGSFTGTVQAVLFFTAIVMSKAHPYWFFIIAGGFNQFHLKFQPHDDLKTLKLTVQDQSILGALILVT